MRSNIHISNALKFSTEAAKHLIINEIVFCILFCLASFSANAQTASVSGKVTDKTGSAVSFASVVIDSLKIGAIADDKGNYKLDNVPAGKHELTVSMVGFGAQTQTISVPQNGNITLNFSVQESYTELQDVEVTGKTDAQVIRETGLNVNVIETKLFENRAMNISQILNQTSGVRIRETGGIGSDFEFSLNGLSGNQVRFFIDGVPLENFGANFNINTIPANMVERIEVYKGVVPIHLGADALGGAVNIVTKQKFSNYIDASYSYGSYNTHLANISGQYREHKSGFTVRPQAYINHSDNNYKMYNLRTYNANGDKFVGDFTRFHDNYTQYFVGGEIGITQKKYADELLFGVSYSNRNKDIQTGYRGERNQDGSFNLDPFGAAFSISGNINYSLKYRNAHLLNNKLIVNANLSGNFITEQYIDTLTSDYNWLGEVIKTYPYGGKTTYLYHQKYVLLNTGASYTFNKHHQISANVIYDFLWRQGRNTYYPPSSSRADPFLDPNHLSKSVIGISYQNTLWKQRLQTTASLKMYHIDILAREAKEYQWGTFVTEDVRSKRVQFGGGLASRLMLKNFIIKTSYEYALRQPEQIEIFGDGFLILTSPNLKPETSHNINLGAEYKWKLSENNIINISADGFVRKVKNLIRVAPGDGRFIQYINLLKTLVAGVEGEIRYNHRFNGGHIFTVGGNITYQSVMNDEKYLKGTTISNYVYRNQLYNTPSLFGNWDVNFMFNLNKLTAKTPIKLNLFYSGNYVKAFYLNYPSIATAGYKNTVPMQCINNIGATLSVQDCYHLTFECNNLANTLAYDNFAIQKTGRTFNVKLRVFINQFGSKKTKDKQE